MRFLMGNDEHSQNVFKKATEAGTRPAGVLRPDGAASSARPGSALDISFDDFIRTTEPRHKAGVTDAGAADRTTAGDIYEGVYEGWYCVGCEAFKQEKDLVDGKCPLHLTDAAVDQGEELLLPALEVPAAAARALRRASRSSCSPTMRRNEILRLLEGGLEDISVSRAGQAWGIPLPFDPTSVVYVWFDALINYASAVGLGGDEALFETWWPADLHVIGKDITRFHSRHLAGDADERRAAAAAAGLRPRLHDRSTARG